MFEKTVQNRVSRANWPCMGLGKITKREDIKRVRSWLRENAGGEYVVRIIKETKGTRQITVATFIRFAEETDALMFKLAWYDYQ